MHLCTCMQINNYLLGRNISKENLAGISWNSWSGHGQVVHKFKSSCRISWLIAALHFRYIHMYSNIEVNHTIYNNLYDYWSSVTVIYIFALILAEYCHSIALGKIYAAVELWFIFLSLKEKTSKQCDLVIAILSNRLHNSTMMVNNNSPVYTSNCTLNYRYIIFCCLTVWLAWHCF